MFSGCIVLLTMNHIINSEWNEKYIGFTMMFILFFLNFFEKYRLPSKVTSSFFIDQKLRSLCTWNKLLFFIFKIKWKMVKYIGNYLWNWF